MPTHARYAVGALSMRRVCAALLVAVASITGLQQSNGAESAAIESALAQAGDNAAELREALATVPEPQRPGMRFLIAHMPADDLQELSAEFLVEHVVYAYRAWEESPWREQVDEALFFNDVLPYASVNERRDQWRKDFYERFTPMVKGVNTPGEAAAKLNNEIFPLLKVKYSKRRRKADQSPYETIQSGLASCTGLSVLLIDACRSVGVPARFVGTPLWSDNSGNHSWVEVWDGGWHFTGAAEPAGMELDRGWFGGRASRAQRDNPRYAIYATSFRHTPLSFPMVWDRRNQSVSAVNVSDRYTSKDEAVPEGSTSVRFCVVDPATRQRVQCTLSVEDSSGQTRFSGETKDERFDGNDHLSATLPGGERYRVVARREGVVVEQEIEAHGDEQLVTLRLPGADDPVQQLVGYLAEPRDTRPPLADQPFAKTGLTREQAERGQQMLWEDHEKMIRETRAQEMEAKTLVDGDFTMPFAYTVFGEKPPGGRSLYISMHGGGGTAERVNTQQWKNQQRLYRPAEGVYLAPRAPTDTWNLWQMPHIDRLFTRLIEDLIVLEDVDPDRVYVMGYSAGGDGAFQLAPRMADRWAAAAMMAGHPGDASPLGLRNIGFAVYMGGRDGAYKRNEHAARWKEKLAELRSADPEGYFHKVTIYPEKGHWMDGEDASALPWLAAQTRNPLPEKVVWQQDNITHDRFYWLSIGDQPVKKGATIVATRDAQQVSIEADGIDEVTVLLNDEMLDLDKPLRITSGERVLFEGTPERTIAMLSKTLDERGDPRGVFSAAVTVRPGGDAAGE
ncbi:Transglutaminase-like superfamily protein [Pirellulimonas nuda]|uniref:Transglutaminase-like superfamily protein n=2 Tax=Pirellulimonas nuda TaxID=2528009 RepID=A0A518DBN2_9BACT|nr:Transglutaminase-like superfamily protein [Pirellulimonas nuda]